MPRDPTRINPSILQSALSYTPPKSRYDRCPEKEPVLKVLGAGRQEKHVEDWTAHRLEASTKGRGRAATGPKSAVQAQSKTSDGGLIKARTDLARHKSTRPTVHRAGADEVTRWERLGIHWNLPHGELDQRLTDLKAIYIKQDMLEDLADLQDACIEHGIVGARLRFIHTAAEMTAESGLRRAPAFSGMSRS